MLKWLRSQNTLSPHFLIQTYITAARNGCEGHHPNENAVSSVQQHANSFLWAEFADFRQPSLLWDESTMRTITQILRLQTVLKWEAMPDLSMKRPSNSKPKGGNKEVVHGESG